MKPFYIIIIALSIIFCATRISAQDSTFIESYGNLFSIKTFFYNDKFSLVDNESGLNYIPDNHLGIGIGLWCKYLPFDVFFRQELSNFGSPHFHKHKTTDLQLRSYNSFFAGDIYIQRYTGFVAKLAENINQNSDEGILYPDLTISHFGAVGQYIFNGKEFSYKAGFSQNEKQNISAGSFLLGAAIYHLSVESDKPLFKDTVSVLKGFNLGPNIGYGYNFVIGKHFLIHTSAVLGINYSNYKFSKIFSRSTELAPVFHFKGTIWYQKKYWSLGVVAAWNSIMETFNKDYNLYLNTGRTQIMYIRRIVFKDKN